jgi:hypothetical protein
MPGAQTGHNEFLFGHGRRRFFEHAVHLVETGLADQPPGSDRAVMRKLAFVRCLHRRHRAGLRRGNINQLPGARFLTVGNIEVVTDQKQERLASGERMGAEHRVSIAERFRLLDELNAIDVRSGGRRKRTLIARGNHQADFLDTGLQDFFKQDGERRFGLAIAVHQRLQRQAALVPAGGGDDSFADFHGRGGWLSQITVFMGCEAEHRERMAARQVKSNRSSGTVWCSVEPAARINRRTAPTLQPEHDFLTYHHIKMR